MTTLLLLFFFSSFSFSQTTLQPTSFARSLFSVVSRSSGLLLIALRPKNPHEEILKEYREENRKNLTPNPSPQCGEGYQDKRNVDSSIIKRRQAPATPKTEWGARASAWSGSADRDPNRIHLTDPLVMDFIRNMTTGNKAIKIGDIGCGDGYLALKIHEAHPGCFLAVDCPGMIQIAQTKNLQTPSIDYLEDSASRLDNLGENCLHAAIYNFVLQDCERLPECMEQLGRVLKPNGKAIIVIPHPAFRSGEKYLELHTQEVHELLGVRYNPPIHVFSRPLAVYVSEFMKSGFVVEKMIEPRLSEEQKKTLNEIDLRQLDTPNPISVAFIVRKKTRRELERDSHLISTRHDMDFAARDHLVKKWKYLIIRTPQIEFSTEQSRQILEAGKWISILHFLETYLLLEHNGDLLLPVSKPCSSDIVERHIMIHVFEQEPSIIFQKISKNLRHGLQTISMIPHPCFTDSPHSVSCYHNAIIESGLELVGMFEASSLSKTFILFILRKALPWTFDTPFSDTTSEFDEMPREQSYLFGSGISTPDIPELASLFSSL